MDSGSTPVLPQYGRSTLADLLPSVLSGCAAAGFQDVLDLPQARSWVVLLVDGLGALALDEHTAEAPYLASLRNGRAPLTACLPSTTATSITSLGTGLPPGQHGVVGYTSRIPGTLTLLNALTWDDAVDPVVWQPHPTVFGTRPRRGCEATVVSRTLFEGTGLTLVSQRGATYVGADSPWLRISGTAVAAETSGSLTYTYDAELDRVGHQYGCRSEQWRETLRTVDDEAQALRDALPPGTGLIVTGDHGMVDVPDTDRIDADASESLCDGVVLLGGEARFRQLWTRAGSTADVLAAWREACGERAWVVTREEAEEAGWFGSVDATVRPRVGDVLVAARGTFAVLASRRFTVETSLVGFHGSVTPEEMYVPLLVDVVD